MWVILHAFFCSADFFFKTNFFFQKILSVKQFGSRSGPTLWVKAVYKYQQTTLAGKELILLTRVGNSIDRTIGSNKEVL